MSIQKTTSIEVIKGVRDERDKDEAALPSNHCANAKSFGTATPVLGLMHPKNP